MLLEVAAAEPFNLYEIVSIPSPFSSSLASTLTLLADVLLSIIVTFLSAEINSSVGLTLSIFAILIEPSADVLPLFS